MNSSPPCLQCKKYNNATAARASRETYPSLELLRAVAELSPESKRIVRPDDYSSQRDLSDDDSGHDAGLSIKCRRFKQLATESG